MIDELVGEISLRLVRTKEAQEKYFKINGGDLSYTQSIELACYTGHEEALRWVLEEILKQHIDDKSKINDK